MNLNSGYEKNAVPHNYLDEPPKNILDVKKNLVLLKRIITSFNTTDIFKVFILISNFLFNFINIFFSLN